MNLNSIGKYIRKYRLLRNMRQEDLAEKVNLSTNYIGMIERGEKIPALDTFVKIVNCLDISADILLEDVITSGYKVKNSILSEKLESLPPVEQNRIYAVIETLIEYAKQAH